jgi:hypothetical protein
MGAVTVPSPPALTQSAFAPSSGRASAGVELTATRSRRGRRRHSGKGNLICGPSRRRWPARQDQRNATRPQGFAAEGDRMGRHPSGQNLQRLPPKFGNLHRRAVLLRNAFTGNSSCLPRFVSKALSQRRQARCEAARPAPAKRRPARSRCRRCQRLAACRVRDHKCRQRLAGSARWRSLTFEALDSAAFLCLNISPTSS